MERRNLLLVLAVERNKEKKEKGERGRGRKKIIYSSSDLRRFDDRNSSDQKVKSIYSMRATLQEIEILPPLVYFTIRAVWPDFL